MTVYLIRAVGDDGHPCGLTKIGYTDKPVEVRRRKIQLMSPVKLKVVCYVRGDRDMEDYLHRKYYEELVSSGVERGRQVRRYRRLRKWGEWFDLSPEKLEEVMQLMERLEPPEQDPRDRPPQPADEFFARMRESPEEYGWGHYTLDAALPGPGLRTVNPVAGTGLNRLGLLPPGGEGVPAAPFLTRGLNMVVPDTLAGRLTGAVRGAPVRAYFTVKRRLGEAKVHWLALVYRVEVIDPGGKMVATIQ